MSDNRKKFLSVATAIVGLIGLILYLSVVFSSNKPVDYARGHSITVIALDKLKTDEPQLLEHNGWPFYAYISSATGKPVLLEAFVKYDDSEHYRYVEYGPGEYGNGDSYTFIEPGKGGWFTLQGKMLPSINVGYSGELMPVEFQIKLDRIYVGE